MRSLIEALQFTQTETFTIAPTDAVPPEVAEPRAAIRKINQEGLKLIKSFEGLYLKAYRDEVDVWTIGWGATEGVHPGMEITVAEAEKMLQDELEKFEVAVADAVTADQDRLSLFRFYVSVFGVIKERYSIDIDQESIWRAQ